MVDKSTKKQLGGATGKGFMPGVSGNPKGRPKGSVSIVGRAKQLLKEDPSRLNEIAENLLKDKKLRVELIRQIDGAPTQKHEVGGSDIPLTIEIVKFNKDGNNKVKNPPRIHSS